MKVQNIVNILKAEILAEGDLQEEVKTACGSDMMSDVLAFVKDQSVLLTGLVNPQVVRTAEMMDMHCIIFVRGKRPDETVLSLARQKDHPRNAVQNVHGVRPPIRKRIRRRV